MTKARLGSGKRFRSLEGKLARRGAKNPAGLAAYIGRKKYGNERFEHLAEEGKRRLARHHPRNCQCPFHGGHP